MFLNKNKNLKKHTPFFFYTKILGRGLGSTQSKGRTPNSWSTGACPCVLWSMTSKPFMSVHTGRLLPVSLSYGDASPSAAMETQQSVTPQDRTRDVVDNPTLIVQSLRHWTHGRWVETSFSWVETNKRRKWGEKYFHVHPTHQQNKSSSNERFKWTHFHQFVFLLLYYYCEL